jgi:hypothetical protein
MGAPLFAPPPEKVLAVSVAGYALSPTVGCLDGLMF